MQPPPLVGRALELAAELGLEGSCSLETGRLLHVLAAAVGRLRVAEIGSGAGLRGAWIVSALDPDVPFVTVERDERRAAAVATLFRQDLSVRVLAGDWRELLPEEAPFDLLCVDAAEVKQEVETLLGFLAPRGTTVLDDSSDGRLGLDERRRAWLEHPELAAVEVPISAASAVVVAVRRT
jgi:predicted O-methyltransferase YrrM